MDPLRLDMSLNEKKKADIVKKNQKVLLKYVETIWTSIQNSFRVCPAYVRRQDEKYTAVGDLL